MKQIVLGTAGHIDHGKTALVKALTGIDTDRLKEEKERGITIDIGFAHLELPSGIRLSIVDVPGHERFVKNMLAGAHGIDMVLLVVAADEGVMPQTVEHLDIVTLLSVNRGLTALTKIDLVEDDWLNLVTEEVRDFLKGSFLAESPILPVSSTGGQGIKELIEKLDQVAGQVAARSSAGPFRLPIDRVFTMKGFGTVVTGTLISGQVKVGDMVEVLPKGLSTKVRGLQVHNQPAAQVSAGMRTAINLQGIEKVALERGDALVHPGTFTPSYLIEAYVKQLAGSPRPLKRRTPVRLYLGTREVMASVIPLDREEIGPGEEGFAQLRLQGAVVASKGDHFVLRSYSPMVTIGGGEVLDPNPPRRRQEIKQIAVELDTLKRGKAAEVVELFVQRAGYAGIDLKLLAGGSGFFPEELAPLLEGLIAEGRLVKLERDGTWLFHGDIFSRLKNQVLETLTQFHRTNPLKEGMSKEELKSKLPRGADARIVGRLLEELTAQGRLSSIKEHVRLVSHSVVLGEEEKALKERLVAAISTAGLAPPTVSELAQALGVPLGKAQELLSLLTNQGVLVRVKETLFFHSQAINELKARVTDYLRRHGEINPTQYKELSGVSRKFTVPLMEYFDRMRLTIRIGDNRRLRENFSGTRTSNLEGKNNEAR